MIKVEATQIEIPEIEIPDYVDIGYTEKCILCYDLSLRMKTPSRKDASVRLRLSSNFLLTEADDSNSSYAPFQEVALLSL